MHDATPQSAWVPELEKGRFKSQTIQMTCVIMRLVQTTCWLTETGV